MSTHVPTHTRTYRRLVEGSTINGTTLLSTDYLNHFNEFVMLLELTADMPDMAVELGEWAPKSYQRHFEDSGFSHQALAVAAYEQAPSEFRDPFDTLVSNIDRRIEAAMTRVHGLIAHPDSEAAAHEIREIALALRAAIERAGAVINGARFEDLETPDTRGEPVMGQTDIDALFG